MEFEGNFLQRSRVIDVLLLQRGCLHIADAGVFVVYGQAETPVKRRILHLDYRGLVLRCFFRLRATLQSQIALFFHSEDACEAP